MSSETRVEPVAGAGALNLAIHVLALPVTFEPLFHINAKAPWRMFYARSYSIEAIALFRDRDHHCLTETPYLAACHDAKIFLYCMYVSHTEQGMRNPFLLVYSVNQLALCSFIPKVVECRWRSP